MLWTDINGLWKSDCGGTGLTETGSEEVWLIIKETAPIKIVSKSHTRSKIYSTYD